MSNFKKIFACCGTSPIFIEIFNSDQNEKSEKFTFTTHLANPDKLYTIRHSIRLHALTLTINIKFFAPLRLCRA